MQDLAVVFARLQEKKKEKKELTQMFKDELENNGDYQKILEDIRVLKEKKKSIEDAAKANALHDVQKLEALKEEITGSMELLSDLALTKYVDGETVELKDEYDNRLVPVFKVSFRKEEGESMQQQIEAERAKSHPERELAPA